MKASFLLCLGLELKGMLKAEDVNTSHATGIISICRGTHLGWRGPGMHAADPENVLLGQLRSGRASSNLAMLRMHLL